jgi:signal transduction histidine kinase
LADVTMLLATARQRDQALQLLSHDMRSPLTSILAMIEHDAESRGRPDPGKKTFETRVEANARRALALADGFVQFARAEAAPLNRTLVDLGDVVSEAADQLWPQATRKSVALIQEGDEAPCLVWADASLISRAVCNLLDNAVKFSPAGGRVTISLAAEAPGRPGHRLMSVRDQGPGLSAAQIQSLFEPFQRFSNEEPGAGLGLAFVRSTILRHGGEVACDSRPGEGAVFMITLPAAEDGV